MRKKTFMLDQDLVEKTRTLLGARTETEAVTRAMEEILRRERFAEALESMARRGPFDPSRI